MALIDQFIHPQGLDAAFQFNIHDLLMILITIPLRRGCFMYHPLHGLEIGDRQGGIELHHLVAHRARERRGLGGGAQGDAHISLGILRVGDIEGWPGISIETKVFDIADDADDFRRPIR